MPSEVRVHWAGCPPVPALAASSGGSLPLGNWDAQPACAAVLLSFNRGIWVSSEASSVDLVVLFKEERGLARGYLAGLGEFGNRLLCLGVSEYGRRVSMCCLSMDVPLPVYVQRAARVSINAFTTSPSVSFPLRNRETQTARSSESFVSNRFSWNAFGTDLISRAARK